MAYGSIVLRRWQHPTMMAGNGSGTTKATVVCDDGRNGSWYDDNGIGLCRRQTTAAANVDDSSGDNDEALNQAQCRHTKESPQLGLLEQNFPEGVRGGCEPLALYREVIICLSLGRVLSLGGAVVRDGGCIRGWGRDKRAHCDINTSTEV